jgi:hypothetical protein
MESISPQQMHEPKQHKWAPQYVGGIFHNFGVANMVRILTFVYAKTTI